MWLSYSISYIMQLYSGTSDKGPSEIGTTSLYTKDTCCSTMLIKTLVYYFTSEIGTTSL